ncbi:uncharacterized protein LOC135464087 isoform X2 [Liolophura sinensis]
MAADNEEKKLLARGSDICSLLFSVVIMAIATALVAVGGWLLSSPLVSQVGPTFEGSIWYSGSVHAVKMPFMEFAGLVSCVGGGIVIFFMILALIGITSSKHSAHCYIGTYVICLIISIAYCICLFVKGVPSAWEEETDVLFLKEEFIANYEGPDGESVFSKAFTELQVNSKCCGLYDPVEIRGPNSLNFTSWPNATFPLPGSCETADMGCREDLLKKANVFYLLVVALSVSCMLTQIPALLNALCLFSAT